MHVVAGLTEARLGVICSSAAVRLQTLSQMGIGCQLAESI